MSHRLIPINEMVTEDNIPLKECNFVHEIIDDGGDIREINVTYLIERLKRERNGYALEGDKLYHIFSTRYAAVLQAIHNIEVKLAKMAQDVKQDETKLEHLKADNAMNSVKFKKKEEKPTENIGGVRI